METLFREKFSVPAENITIVKDEQVTKDGVKKSHCLIWQGKQVKMIMFLYI